MKKTALPLSSSSSSKRNNNTATNKTTNTNKSLVKIETKEITYRVAAGETQDVFYTIPSDYKYVSHDTVIVVEPDYASYTICPNYLTASSKGTFGNNSNVVRNEHSSKRIVGPKAGISGMAGIDMKVGNSQQRGHGIQHDKSYNHETNTDVIKIHIKVNENKKKKILFGKPPNEILKFKLLVKMIKKRKDDNIATSRVKGTTVAAATRTTTTTQKPKQVTRRGVTGGGGGVIQQKQHSVAEKENRSSSKKKLSSDAIWEREGSLRQKAANRAEWKKHPNYRNHIPEKIRIGKSRIVDGKDCEIINFDGEYYQFKITNDNSIHSIHWEDWIYQAGKV